MDLKSLLPKQTSSNIIFTTTKCIPFPFESLNNAFGRKTSKLDYERHWTHIWTTSRRNESFIVSSSENNILDSKSNYVKYNDITILRRIGEGGQALIYEAIYKNKKIAMKIYKAHNLQYNVWPKEFFEFENYNICRPLFPILMDDETYSLAMELYSLDLRKILDKRLEENKENACLYAPPFKYMVTIDMILQIAMGMEKLHKANFVHCDLKAANVLVLSKEPFSDGTYMIGISDFEAHCIGGTSFWRAPEIIEALEFGAQLPIDERKTLPFTHEGDVYSFGMLCYEIITGEVPFQEQQKLPFDIIGSGNRPKLPMDINETIKMLIWECWNGDPKARPTFKTIVSELTDLIVETKELECILQKKKFVSSKDLCKLMLEIEKFEQELKIYNPNNNSKVVHTGEDFLKSVRAYLAQYESEKSLLNHSLNVEKYELYKKALDLYEDSFKKCKKFHIECCMKKESEYMNHTHLLLFNLSTRIAYHLPQ